MTKILAFILSFSAISMAAAVDPQFLKMTEPGLALVSHPPLQTWKEGEFLCVFHGDKAAACGAVSKSEPAGAFIRIDFTDSTELMEGDRVAKPRTGKETAPVAIVESNNVWLAPYAPSKWLFRTGLMADLDQIYSVAAFDRSVHNHLAYGLKVEWYDTFNMNKGLDGYGLLLTRTFFTLPYFHGVGATLGFGPYFFRNPTGYGAPSTTTFIAEFSVAWRFDIRSWLAFGVNFGVRWIPKFNAPSFDIGPKYHPLRGALGLDISIRF
jgi:hypothetical protein